MALKIDFHFAKALSSSAPARCVEVPVTGMGTKGKDCRVWLLPPAISKSNPAMVLKNGESARHQQDIGRGTARQRQSKFAVKIP